MKEIFLHELQQLRADPRRLLFLFGAAAAYLLIFGILYQPNLVKNIPTIIFDDDNTKISRELIRGFEDSDSFSIIGYADSEETMKQALHDKKALLAIEVPKNFSRAIKRGNASEFLFVVNGANIIVTNVTSSAAQDISAAISDKIAAQRLALTLGANENDIAKKISPVHTSLRVLFNSTQGYTFFFLIGLAMAAFQQGILFSFGASLLQEKLFTWKVWLIKGILYWLLSMISFAMIIVVINLCVGIPLRAPFYKLLILGGAYILGMMGLCAVVSSLFNREVTFIRAAIMYPVPAFILSGYTWPLESMSSGMQFVSKFFPLSYLSNNVRELFLVGTVPKFFEDILFLLIFGAICFTLGIIIRRRNSLKISPTEQK